MKQEIQVANHHREGILIEEYLRLEEEAEEEIFGVTLVDNWDMCRGTVLLINQQVK